LVTVLGDLYGAGSGTTSITLTFAILYLITHPKVQSKLQAEIDDVIGKSRMPTLADKAKYIKNIIQIRETKCKVEHKRTLIMY
jgi:cytochrome P450